jgi:hypothetical protein
MIDSEISHIAVAVRAGAGYARGLVAQIYNEMQLTSYVDQIMARMERLERQLLLVSDKVGIPMEDPRAGVADEVVELVRAGDRLGAIRKFRELNPGASVEDAQAAIAAI